MKFVVIEFKSVSEANEFSNVLEENGMVEEFDRSSSHEFSMSFPDETEDEENKREVEQVMFSLGYNEGSDYTM